MKLHRGETVANAVRESGMSLTALANRLGVSRRTVYNYFDRPDLSTETILEIGRIIHVDFSPIFKKGEYTFLAQKPEVSDDGGEDTAEFWKKKYIQLMEQFNELLVKRMDTKG
jgi:predicted transcriptional regulator